MAPMAVPMATITAPVVVSMAVTPFRQARADGQEQRNTDGTRRAGTDLVVDCLADSDENHAKNGQHGNHLLT